MNIADESSKNTGLTSRSSETSENSGETNSNQLTSSVEGFRAKTLAEPENSKELPESAVGYGQTSLMWFADYDRESSLWKTRQVSLMGHSELFSETWPQSGTILNGTAYPLAPLVLHTHGNGCSLWPTPKASQAGPDFAATETRGRTASLQTVVAALESGRWTRSPDGSLNVPTAGKNGAIGTDDTGQIALVNLMSYGNETDRNARSGGPLNPEWEEWLMGFPIGWSELPLSATPSSPRLRSGSVGGSSRRTKR